MQGRVGPIFKGGPNQKFVHKIWEFTDKIGNPPIVIYVCNGGDRDVLGRGAGGAAGPPGSAGRRQILCHRSFFRRSGPLKCYICQYIPIFCRQNPIFVGKFPHFVVKFLVRPPLKYGPDTSLSSR